MEKINFLFIIIATVIVRSSVSVQQSIKPNQECKDISQYNITKNYCNVYSCRKKRKSHTACTYKKGSIGKRCLKGGDLGGRLTDTQINDIVNRHNEIRKKVALGLETRGLYGRGLPAARNMAELKWDTELASMAQLWADQCTFEHDPCRDVDRFWLGQNIGEQGDVISKAKYFNPLNIVNRWYNEVDNFDPRIIDYFQKATSKDKEYGHYTQLIWAESCRIGCGIRHYMDDHKNLFQYLVCVYGPAGNVKTWPVYIR